MNSLISINRLQLFLKIATCLLFNNYTYSTDLTLVGQLWHGDGLGKIAINFIECLKDRVSINWLPLRNNTPVYEDLPLAIHNIIKKNDSSIGRVAILTDIPWVKGQKVTNLIHGNPVIKIAYSMIESTRIPKNWVTIFNRHFDAVVVPDDYFMKVYKDSGVTIPLFTLPLAMDLKPFLKCPPKTKNKKHFVFGNLSQARPHKNLELLINSFDHAFHNNPHVKLIINSRYAEDPHLIKKIIRKNKSKNIHFYNRALKFDEMLSLMKTFDCYVSFSKGEGFSLIPREMLALGIPVILSDNTAQSTLCKTGFVRAVPSEIFEKAFYKHLSKDCGFQFNTSLTDATEALLDVYNNYETYLLKAQKGKKWVKNYAIHNLAAKYYNLVKPKKVILGNKNIITKEYLMTTSPQLVKKYVKLRAKNIPNNTSPLKLS